MLPDGRNLALPSFIRSLSNCAARLPDSIAGGTNFDAPLLPGTTGHPREFPGN